MSNRKSKSKSKRGGFIGPLDKRKYNKLINEEGLQTCGNFGFSEGFDCDNGTYDPTECPDHCREGKSSSSSSVCDSFRGTCIPDYTYKKKMSKKRGGKLCRKRKYKKGTGKSKKNPVILHQKGVVQKKRKN
jgi:hypothetical protein